MGSHAIPRTTAERRRDRIRAVTVLGVSAGSTLLGAGVVAAVAGGIAFPGTASGDEGAATAPSGAAAAAGALPELDVSRDPGVSRDEERQPLALDSAAPATDAAQAAAGQRLAGAADAHARQVAAAEAERVAAEQAAAAAAAEAERVAAEQAAAAAAAEAERVAAERAAAAASFGVDPDSNRGIAAAAIGAYGWGSTQFECLNVLWQRESNWNHLAENPSSGAYGIPQSLPANKMATVGSDYRTNPVTQITWGLDYIEDAYGTPCNAWAFWQDNNWY